MSTLSDAKAVYSHLFLGSAYAQHPEHEGRYLAGLLPLTAIGGLRSVLDLGSGRGTFARIVHRDWPSVRLETADLDRFHDVPVPHWNVDLAEGALPEGPWDLITVLDVLEHLPEAAVVDTLTAMARRCTYAVATVGMHSDVWRGTELHLTIRERDWWAEAIGRDFHILREGGWPRGAAFILQSKHAPLEASVCLSTFDKPEALARTLASIRAQAPAFAYEVIVADDGSSHGDQVAAICHQHLARHVALPASGYRNPGPARNAAYRLATAPIIVAQSDEVQHRTDALTQLVDALEPRTARLATVLNVDANGRQMGKAYTSRSNPRPLFFLGALWREDLYAVGGNDEDFTEPGYEDLWFADCLAMQRKVRFIYDPDVLGWHYDHPRPALDVPYAAMSALWRRKRARAIWTAAGGPWPLDA